MLLTFSFQGIRFHAIYETNTMRNLSRSRRFIPSVDSLNLRLLLSTTGAVITPMDPVPVGYTDGSDEDPSAPAASGPTVVVITPMDPVPVGYTDGSDEDPAASGPTSGYANDDTSNAPSWAAPAAAMGDMLVQSPDDSSAGPTDPTTDLTLTSTDPDASAGPT
jgi:hypothetical protein